MHLKDEAVRKTEFFTLGQFHLMVLSVDINARSGDSLGISIIIATISLVVNVLMAIYYGRVTKMLKKIKIPDLNFSSIARIIYVVIV